MAHESPEGGCLPPLPRIAVIGAGVVGLSVAYELIRELGEDNVDVTVIAESFMDQTTTYGSGGLWEPYQIAGTPEEDVNKWGKVAFDHFLEIYHSEECGAAGVQIMGFYQLFTAEQEKDYKTPSFHDIVFNFQHLSARELKKMELPEQFTKAYSFSTIVVEQKYYMSWMMRRLEALGVRFIQRHLSSLDEVSGVGYDIVVNCAGLGACELVGDTSMYPIRYCISLFPY